MIITEELYCPLTGDRPGESDERADAGEEYDNEADWPFR